MLGWLKANASSQRKDLKEALNTWQGQNNAMHELSAIMLKYGDDMEIADAILTMWKALKTAPKLPKNAVVWRAIPKGSMNLTDNPEKWMSVSASKEGALNYAHGRNMKLCKIIIQDDNIRGLPVNGSDEVLDDENEIIICPGFNARLIDRNNSDALIFSLTLA